MFQTAATGSHKFKKSPAPHSLNSNLTPNIDNSIPNAEHIAGKKLVNAIETIANIASGLDSFKVFLPIHHQHGLAAIISQLSNTNIIVENKEATSCGTNMRILLEGLVKDIAKRIGVSLEYATLNLLFFSFCITYSLL